jgi:hypothetical protein
MAFVSSSSPRWFQFCEYAASLLSEAVERITTY